MGLVTYNHIWAGPHEQAPEPVNKELCQERGEGNLGFSQRAGAIFQVWDQSQGEETQFTSLGEVQPPAEPPGQADLEGNQ